MRIFFPNHFHRVLSLNPQTSGSRDLHPTIVPSCLIMRPGPTTHRSSQWLLGHLFRFTIPLPTPSCKSWSPRSAAVCVQCTFWEVVGGSLLSPERGIWFFGILSPSRVRLSTFSGFFHAHIIPQYNGTSVPEFPLGGLSLTPRRTNWCYFNRE